MPPGWHSGQLKALAEGTAENMMGAQGDGEAGAHPCTIVSAGASEMLKREKNNEGYTWIWSDFQLDQSWLLGGRHEIIGADESEGCCLFGRDWVRWKLRELRDANCSGGLEGEDQTRPG